MFYSHEVLTSRKYGVATVWLVATLGAKSSAKKVTRKAILDVDVRKACNTIIQPEAPMALRLQSNLLYGVSRVYDQQCHYVLVDAQAAHTSIRTMLVSVKNNDIEPGITKARPEQLILLDDPAFLPETALPPLELDFSSLKESLPRGSQRSASMMSIHSHLNSTPRVLGDLQLPSSSTHVGQYQLPLNDPFIGSSAQRFGTIENVRLDEEGEYFQDDMIFEFDDNGEIRDIDESEQQARRAGLISRGHLVHSSAGSPGARKERTDAPDSQLVPLFDKEGGIDVANLFDDGMPVLGDVEPFPMMSGALGGSDQAQYLRGSEEREYSASEFVTSSTVGAAPKSRRARVRQTFSVDRVVELRNSDLSKWQTEYKHTMDAERHQALQRKMNSQAKKRAFWFVYGMGLNSVGIGVGAQMTPSPLDMFLGEALISKITGRPMSSTVTKSKKTKRAAEFDMEQHVIPKRVRTGQSDNEGGLGNFGDEDQIMIDDGSVPIEIGREAPSALADHPSSMIMPWNVSTSLNSHQRGASSSQRGRGHGSAGHRILSASPLVGRGSTIPGPLEQFSMQDKITYGRDDELSHDMDPSLSQAEFEIFGPAAQVDTQTAGDSQWVRDILAQEAGNFFEYVLNTISEKAGDELGDDEKQTATIQDVSVTFEELFDPNNNSKIVAAQAFYHVLAIATKNRVWVRQDGDMEAFGPIRMGVMI